MRAGRPPLRQAADAAARTSRPRPGRRSTSTTTPTTWTRLGDALGPHRRVLRPVASGAPCPTSKTSTARSSSTTTAARATAGELATPPAHRVEGFNPLCGDEVVVYLDVDDDGNVTDLKISGQGCSISQSSASMMSAAVNGKTRRRGPRAHPGLQDDDVDPRAGDRRRQRGRRGGRPRGELGDLAALRGVVKFPVRIKCATLSWNTLTQGLDEIEARAGLTRGRSTIRSPSGEPPGAAVTAGTIR